MKTNDIFLIFAQNIDCGYTSEPHRRGGSNEYPATIYVLEQNTRKKYTHVNTSFTI